MVSEKHVLNKKQVYLVNSLNIKKNEKKRAKGQPRAPVIYFFILEKQTACQTRVAYQN
jgi:hypothetical protein